MALDKKVDIFLRQCKMHCDTIDMHRETAAFQRQMRDGLEGKPSSLQMIPTFITVAAELPAGREVIVMDAGGTNFRVAVVRRESDGTMTVSHFSKHPMPGTRGRLDARAFFSEIVSLLEPVLRQSDAETVGFCFSFATEMLPNREGRIRPFSKELEVEGAVGCLIGENLNIILRERGYEPRRFVLLNDSVATMLAGMAESTGRDYDGFIGYILGTGTNTCYLERCSHIGKIPEAAAMSGQMAINCESGTYDGFTQGIFDQQLDRESNDPGSYRMEKMMSGAYQGKLICKTVKGAAQAGLFTPAFTDRLNAFERFTMPQIDGFCANRNSGDLAELAADKADSETLFDIIDVSFERSARMSAIVFASIILHCGIGKNREKPVCITAEGTSFTKSVLYAPKLHRYIRDFLLGELGLHCDVISVKDATLFGAAIAALMS